MSAVRNAFNDPRHRKSEELVFMAERLAHAGQIDGSRANYAEAGSMELEVARGLGLDGSQPKLRSIFAVSAVAYLVRGARWADAIRAAHEFLARPDLLLADRVAELEDLLDDALRSRELASILPADADVVPLEIRLEGGQVRQGIAPTRLIQERERVAEALLLRVADWRANKNFRSGGQSAYAGRFTFFEAPARAASYGIRFFVAPAGQVSTKDVDVTPRDAVESLLELAGLASEGVEAIQGRVKDEKYAKAFLRAFRDIAPDGSSLEAVSFSSSRTMARRPVTRFVPSTRSALSEALARAHEQRLDVCGVLKIVNLHKPRRITVMTDDGARTVFRLRPGEHDDTIGPKLNRRVRVLGRREHEARGELNVADDVVVLEGG